jgi:hypothetical protein
MLTISACNGSAQVQPNGAARISLDEDAPRHEPIGYQPWRIVQTVAGLAGSVIRFIVRIAPAVMKRESELGATEKTTSRRVPAHSC